jgi:aminopeptidase N
MGLLTADGRELPLQLSGENGPQGKSRVMLLEQARQSFTFVNVQEPPIPSLLRGFSAPVKLDYPYRREELATLMMHDSDAFVRWEAAQLLAQREIMENVDRLAAGRDPRLGDQLLAAFRKLLADEHSDPALVAEALTLPDEDYLGEQMPVIDVDGIHAAREFVRAELAKSLAERWLRRYRDLASDTAYDKSAASMARRSLRNVCLSYLLRTPSGFELAEAQLRESDNMTDTLAALQGLAWTGAPGAASALSDFERRWRGDSLVMDKWFAIQASVPGPGTVDRVRELLEHSAFSITNPNKVRALLGAFGMMNPTGFHTPGGAGYRLMADQVIALNGLNPQVAARMAAAFNSWTRYDAHRRDLIERELVRIQETPGLSPDVSEIVSNALAMGSGAGNA